MRDGENAYRWWEWWWRSLPASAYTRLSSYRLRRDRPWEYASPAWRRVSGRASWMWAPFWQPGVNRKQRNFCNSRKGEWIWEKREMEGPWRVICSAADRWNPKGRLWESKKKRGRKKWVGLGPLVREGDRRYPVPGRARPVTCFGTQSRSPSFIIRAPQILFVCLLFATNEWPCQRLISHPITIFSFFFVGVKRVTARVPSVPSRTFQFEASVSTFFTFVFSSLILPDKFPLTNTTKFG